MKQATLRVLAALFAIQGCTLTNNPTGTVTKMTSGPLLTASVLINTLQCGSDLTVADAVLLNNSQQLAQRYLQLPPAERDTISGPALDFKEARVLLITMGQRPSGGYLLNYQQQAIRFNAQNGILEVEVAWQVPLPGYNQAQVVTTPCLLLKIPILESVKRIRVWDQENKLKLDVAIPGQ